MRNLQISVWKTNFFPRQAMPQSSYSFYNLVTHGILDTEFGSLWTTPWPDEKDLFLKFVICEFRKFSYEKLIFFLGKLCQKIFSFYNLVTQRILDTEFGSIWTTPWPDQKYYISKLNIWNNSKFPYEKLTFFLGKLYQKLFLFYNLVTHGIHDTEFGSLWTTPWPD